MTDRHLTFVASVEDAPPPRQGSAVVVLDPTWTPTIGDRLDLLPVRRVTGAVVERVDLLTEARRIVDGWATQAGMADALTVEGVTYWFRFRETMWRWVHERLLWREVIIELESGGTIDAVELVTDDAGLADVLRARWPSARIATTVAEAAAPTRATAAPAARLGRLVRLFGRGGSEAPTSRAAGDPAQGEERRRRESVLNDRVATLGGSVRPRVIVLTNPGTHQRIGGVDGGRQDPLFGAVIPVLAGRGDQPVLVATGLDQRRDEDWMIIADDPQMLPQFLLRTRWSRSEDDDRSRRAIEGIVAAIDEAATTPVRLHGLDLTAAFLGALRAAATSIVGTDVQMLARIERLIEELAPRAILLAQEGIRTPWLIAGARAGIPVVAVQHGVIYPGHAGYPNVRHPALCLPTRTCVFGPFEREALLEMGYGDDEVTITGSPRVDLDVAPPDAEAGAADRQAVRRELEVADGHLLLVISTLNFRLVRDTHFAHMLEVVLGGPLPNVHLVFKLHPGERDDGPYRAILTGLAQAGSYDPAPMTVVKDIDLYRLLRASDAHLGLFSTVLTEAVLADTPNLIATTGRLADLLGYVDAGVATPVRSPREVLAALDPPRRADPAARKAFLARHFRPGDASERIVDTVGTVLDRTTGVPR